MSFQLPSGLKPAQPPQQSGGAGGGGGQDNGEAQEKQRQQEEMKRGMIASMLAPAARERCTSSRMNQLMIVSRIALTRPEMAIRVEDLLVRMGQAGQIRGQVTDEALKGLLQQVRPLGLSSRWDQSGLR
jgi:programmed cell death protein 5